MPWILRANPSKYDLRRRLATDCWIIDWTIHPTVTGGQQAVTIGDGVWFAVLETAGAWGTIYARGRVLSEVVKADDPQRDSIYCNPPDRFKGVSPRTYVEITDHVRPPLLLAKVRPVLGLANMEIFGGMQNKSVFWVTQDEANLLDAQINAQQAGVPSPLRRPPGAIEGPLGGVE